jgi:hypothetical protein
VVALSGQRSPNRRAYQRSLATAIALSQSQRSEVATYSAIDLDQATARPRGPEGDCVGNGAVGIQVKRSLEVNRRFGVAPLGGRKLPKLHLRHRAEGTPRDSREARPRFFRSAQRLVDRGQDK